MSATPTTPTLNLTIDTADLASTSQLKKLLQGNQSPLLTFAAQMAPYWNSNVDTMPNGLSAAITISGSGSWQTATGIGFTLSGSAKCQLKVVTAGPVLQYAPDLQSQPTSQLPADPYPGSVYLVLSLDFQIGAGISGSGNVSGIGISGQVQGSTDTSIVFCHLVQGRQSLADAVEDALERFVFPFEPSCAIDMAAGDLAQVNFNGSLACGLDVSYGINSVSLLSARGRLDAG